jgi:hypothetical protein
MSRALRGQERLGRLSAPLEPECAPYHVGAPQRGHPSPGWYWTPHGTTHPTYLGFNHIFAEHALITLLGRQPEQPIIS